MYNKFIKYKSKYINLIGGSNPLQIPRKIKIHFDTYGSTLTGMIKELVYVSNNIYNFTLSKKSKPNTYLVCVGQSPGYYALSMMNLPQYNESLVKIIILPYSTQIIPTPEQEIKYMERLSENGINFTMDDQIILLDQAQYGHVIGNFIYILQNRIKSPDSIILLNSGIQFPESNIKGIPIINHFTSSNLAIFSDSFPRIVQQYSPKMFTLNPMTTTFINIDTNPYVQMIIDCSRIYPNMDNDWYRLNDFIPDETIKIREEERIRQEKERIIQEKIREAESNPKRKELIEKMKKINKYDEWISKGSNWGLLGRNVIYTDMHGNNQYLKEITNIYTNGAIPVFDQVLSNSELSEEIKMEKIQFVPYNKFIPK